MKIKRKPVMAARSRKRPVKAASDLTIDMWYGDEFNKDEYGADATFYPNEGVYRGNIYDKSGKMVGDYSCSDSVVLEKELGIIFSSTTVRGKRSIKASYDGDLYEEIRRNKDAIIWQWQQDYEGEPNTSWDYIFDSALEEFERYADDEASGNIADTASPEEMVDEFEQFMVWRDLNDYDEVVDDIPF